MTSEVKVLRKTVFNFLIAMLLSLVTLAFIVGFSDVSDIMRALGRVSLRWVMLVLVMMVCDWILESFTVKIFSNAYDVDMKFLYAVKITLIGAFFSAVTPFSTGGQPAQVAFASKRKLSPGKMSAVLVSRFIVYQIVITLLGIIGILGAYRILSQNITKLALLAFLGFALNAGVLVFLVIFSINRKLAEKFVLVIFKPFLFFKIVKSPMKITRKIVEQVKLFHEGMKISVKKPQQLVLAFSATMVQILIRVSMPFFVATSLRVSCNYGDVLIFHLTLFLVVSMIPTPGASGASEGGYVLFFQSLFGQNTVATLLVWRFFTYYINIAVGGVAAIQETRRLASQSKSG